MTSTNEIIPRRFVALSNPGLTRLITRQIGDGWIKNLDELRGLEALAGQQDFQKEWQQIKRDNKLRLAGLVKERTGVETNPDSLFDILVKRIHEYKRKHLSVLHIITLFKRIKQNPAIDMTPRDRPDRFRDLFPRRQLAFRGPGGGPAEVG